MALVISISGYVPPANVPLTMAALRKLAAGFAVSISGTVGAGEIVDGSVSPSKVSPGAYFYGVATFASDVYTVTLSPPLTGLSDGVKILVKVNNANTSTEASLVVNGLPSPTGTPIRKRLNTKLRAGELIPGSIIEFTYNSSGTVAHWEAHTPGLFERQTYALTAGTVASERCSAYTLTLEWDYGDVSQYSSQMLFARAHADCNATPTMKVGASAVAKTLKWLDGRSIAQGEIRRGQIFGFVYDSALDAFVVLGEQPTGVFAAVETSGSATAWTATIPGFPAAPVAGLMISLKVVATNTGPVTLQITTPASGTVHSAIAVKKHYNRALDAQDVINNSYVVLVYDGTNYVLQTPTTQPVVMAMAIFDGAGGATLDPLRSYNIHSTNKITRHSAGHYTVNFATALPSANYAVHVTASYDASNSYMCIVDDPVTNQTTTSVKIGTFVFGSGSFADPDRVYVTIIGFPNS